MGSLFCPQLKRYQWMRTFCRRLQVPKQFSLHCSGKGRHLPSSHLPSVHHFSTSASVWCKHRIQELQHTYDSEDSGWQELYRGILSTQIRMLKGFSLATSALGLTVQPFIYEKLSVAGLGFAIAAGGFISFFTFVTPVIIHWVCKKYVMKLEYDSEKDVYVATTLTFFLQEKKVRFKVGDVYVPEVPGMFTTFHIKNEPFFVDPNTFDDLDHYVRLMGYDKPVHLKIKDEFDKNSR